MNELLKSSGAKSVFLFTLVFLILTDLVILLDIPVLREVLGFLFLTFIPGILLLFLLKLDTLGLLEKVVLSLGLSVAFSLVFGLSVNGLLPLFGYEKPLSTIPLLISFSLAIILLSIGAYIRNRHAAFSFPNLKLTTIEKAFLVVPALLPLLSIWGTRIMNITSSNTCLMLLFFLILAYVIFISFYHGKVSQRLYPCLIYLIGISLLLVYPLRFDHIFIHQDTGSEFYFFQTTLTNLHWGVAGFSELEACLSISLLPSIYQSFMHMNNPEYLFKLLYCFLFSVSPLVVYVLSRKYIGSFYAFLASFFFMSQYAFLGVLAKRAEIAVLFFALAIMILFHDGISRLNKSLLFILFTVCVIFSYYSVTYALIFILLLTWIVMQALPRIMARRRQPANLSESYIGRGDSSAGSNILSARTTDPTPYRQPKKNITAGSVILAFVMIFFWYGQITAVPFTSGVNWIYYTFLNLHNFFVLESRAGVVQPAVGIGLGEAAIPGRIQFVVSWMMVALIAFGAISMLYRYYRYSETVSSPGESLGSGFKFDMEFLAIVLAICLLLVAIVALPFISLTYDISRLWLQAMVVLSLCFVFGGLGLSRYLRIRPYLLIFLVLVPYFMIQTGTLDQLVGRQSYITLNSYTGGMNQWQMVQAQGVIYDQESYSAKWLAKHMKQGEKIYSDNNANQIFTSQAQGFKPRQVSQHLIHRGEINENADEGYIYLRYSAVVYGILHAGSQERYDIAQYSHFFEGKNKLYANGGSEIYR